METINENWYFLAFTSSISLSCCLNDVLVYFSLWQWKIWNFLIDIVVTLFLYPFIIVFFFNILTVQIENVAEVSRVESRKYYFILYYLNYSFKDFSSSYWLIFALRYSKINVAIYIIRYFWINPTGFSPVWNIFWTRSFRT